MNNHIIGVFPPTIATLAVVWLAWKTTDLSPIFKTLAIIAGSLVALQIILGVATFKLHLQVEPLTVTHQAVGASLLGILTALAVLAIRDTKQQAITSKS